MNRVLISFFEETNWSLISPCSELTRVAGVVSSFVDLKLVGKSEKRLHSGGRHVSRIFMQLSHLRQNNFRDVDVLGLSVT